MFCHPGAEESFFIFRISRCRGARRDGRPISVSNNYYSYYNYDSHSYREPAVRAEYKRGSSLGTVTSRCPGSVSPLARLGLRGLRGLVFGCYSRASAGAGCYSQPVIEFDFHCPGRRCSLGNRRHHPFALMVRAVPLWKPLPRIMTLAPPAAGTVDEHPSRRNSGTHSRPPANHPCQSRRRNCFAGRRLHRQLSAFLSFPALALTNFFRYLFSRESHQTGRR